MTAEPIDLILRDAREADAPDLVRLMDQLGYPETQSFMCDRIRRLSCSSDAGILVSELHGKVVGVLAYQFMLQLAVSGEFCRIAYLCVDVQARGKGVGEALEAELLKRAEERNCDRIEVHCSEHRSRAQGFYRRLHYIESPHYRVKRLASD